MKGQFRGWAAFLLGSLGCPTAGMANVGIWVGTVLLARGSPERAGISGAVALLLGAGSGLYMLTDSSVICRQRFEVGYFCWLAAPALLAGAGLGLSRLRPGWRPVICMAATAAVALTVIFAAHELVGWWYRQPTDEVLLERLRSGSVATRRKASNDLLFGKPSRNSTRRYSTRSRTPTTRSVRTLP
jgi:hypothetical protein